MPPEPNWALAGELLLAASGLWPTEPLGRKDAAAAQALPKAWAEEIRALLGVGARTKPWKAPAVRYLATWRKIKADEGAEDITRPLELKEIAAAYEAARDRALDELTPALRPVMLDDLQQTRLLEPSLSRQLAANALVAVAGDPGRIVYGLRAGVISPDALGLYRAVYPAVDKMLRQMVADELQRQRARRAGYRMDWSAEIVLRSFLEIPVGTPSPTSSSAPAEDAAPPPEVPSIDFKRDRLATQTKADRVADLSP